MSRNAGLESTGWPHRPILSWWLVVFLLVGRSDAAPAITPQPKSVPQVRVVIAEDDSAIEAFNPVPKKVRALINRGIVQLTGKPDSKAAWQSLISTQDVVGIKVFSLPGATSGTRPAVVEALIESLTASGVAPRKIVIWDKHIDSLNRAGFDAVAERQGVRLAGSAEVGYDEKTFYETSLLGRLVWGDVEYGRKGEGLGRKSFVTKLLTEDITKIINVTPLLNHNHTGVSGNLYGLAYGCVDNFKRFDSDPDRLATAVPEICALPAVGDRVVLNIVDALICQYQGEEIGLLHYSSRLGQLRFSKDPVALDVLSIEELERQRKLANAPLVKKDFKELYHNASLVEIGVSDTHQVRIEMAP